MKNTKRVLATLALSATLAMGAVPAFAADASVNDSGAFEATDQTTGKGSTQLNVQATASQIQATLPIDITVITPTSGGAITAPTDKAYKIVNNNATTPLKIKSIKGVDGTDWSLKQAFTANKDDMTTKGEMTLSVKAGSSAPLAIKTTDVAVSDDAASYFTIPEGGSLGLTLAGQTQVKTDLTADATVPAVKIEYTVSTQTA